MSGRDLAALAAAYRRDPERITTTIDDHLTRIAAANPTWRAFSHLARDARAEAVAMADALRAGNDRGPLHGVPVGIKGCVPVRGLPWTEGCASYASRIAADDAAVVASLRAAGAIVLGTTTLSELAMYAPDNPFEPMGRNPWAGDRTAGGSSTGAGVGAALGLGCVHVGTDSGGSVRNPACHCGVVGFMASAGALPVEGLIDRTPSLTRVGLVARGVDDIRRASTALGRPDDPTVGARRLLVPLDLVESTADAATRALFQGAMQRLEAAGWTLVDDQIPHWEPAEAAAGVVSLAESAAHLTAADLAAASPRVRARHVQGAALAPAVVAEARERCAAFAEALRTALAKHGADAVLTPTWPFPAPRVDAETVEIDGNRVPVDPRRNVFVRAANAAAATALSLPAGLYAEGVPFGLHLMAPAAADARLLATAAMVEHSIGWSLRAPPVSSRD